MILKDTADKRYFKYYYSLLKIVGDKEVIIVKRNLFSQRSITQNDEILLQIKNLIIEEISKQELITKEKLEKKDSINKDKLKAKYPYLRITKKNFDCDDKYELIFRIVENEYVDEMYDTTINEIQFTINQTVRKSDRKIIIKDVLPEISNLLEFKKKKNKINLVSM